MSFAHIEIVEIVPRRDLHGAAAQLRVGMFIRHNRNLAARDRQDDMLADNACITLIIGMHGHCHICEHCFRARGCNLYIVAPVSEFYAIFKRVFEVPETALQILRLNLKIRNRCLELRVPIHQPFVAINQVQTISDFVGGIVKIYEGLEHRFGKVLVHGELLARPVHRTAQTAQLAGDGAAALFLPLPHLLDKFLARIIGALVLPLFQLAFDHHLRGNPCMVGADNPQGVLAAQAFISDDDILQRIVKRMANMKATGDVRRRIDDGEGFRIGPLGPEQAVLFPMGIPFRLNLGGVESS